MPIKYKKQETVQQDAIFIVSVSTEKRPKNVISQSILYEKDTGNRYRYIENNKWELVDNVHE